jgi:hypothetical protein
MLLASSSAWLFLLLLFFFSFLCRSLRAKCKTEVQAGWRTGRGDFSSFLPVFFFFFKAK